MKHTVFAYGSNLDQRQMSARCPSALVIGPAMLRDHRLVFCGYSTRWDGAVASVERAPGSRVPGLVYMVDSDDLKRLDGFEGAPFVYDRKKLQVLGPYGRKRGAHVYQKLAGEYGTPSRDYYGKIWQAYRAWGLDAAVLGDAIRHAAEEERNERVFEAAVRAASTARRLQEQTARPMKEARGRRR